MFWLNSTLCSLGGLMPHSYATGPKKVDTPPNAATTTPNNGGKLSLLLVDDDQDYRSIVARRFTRRGHDVAHTGSPIEALSWVERQPYDVVIVDVSMPEMNGVQVLEHIKQQSPETQVIMLTGQGTLETAVRAMKLGAYDYLTKPCELAELELHVQRAAEKARLSRENRNLKVAIRQQTPNVQLIGQSPALRQVWHLIERVAPTNNAVLIQGESGTGKELVARTIHQCSPRADHPLIAINCAAFQDTLLESELFGHEKGAFTSAQAAKPGLFEVAHEGTLFIDEVGELSAALQAKLLRVLEDGRIRRVGAVKEIKTDVRIIAATNRDLAKEVAEKRFRDDLYYRLNVVTIHVPPLRERKEDIPLFIDHFLAKSQEGPNRVSDAAMAALLNYSWPGNVRELANVIARAKILAEGTQIDCCDLPDQLTKGNSSDEAATVQATTPPAIPSNRLEQHERELIQTTLQQHHGNKVHAAKSLGISRRKLYRLLEKHGLKAN